MEKNNVKIIDVDLTSKGVRIWQPEKELVKNFLGGIGLNTKFLWDEIPPGADPLGPENVLVFSVGALVGTNMPTACRVEASAKSPLTNGFGTSNSGNFWGSELKFAGYDGLILRGAAKEYVYLYIHDDRISILPAGHLVGKDSWQTISLIREELKDPNIQVACIGQGGEGLCRFASIQNGPSDAWGRTGLGAVMGSKKIKAIAVRGTKGIAIHDKKRFLELVERAKKEIYESPFFGPFHRYGTMLATVPYHEFGALPGRNFQVGTLPDWVETRSRKLVPKYSKRGISCISCPIACAHWVEINEEPYTGLKMKDLEVTPLIGFGAGCEINNIPAIVKLTEMCQRYGLDLVSASSTIAFAMELYQRNIVREEDIGFPLEWGDEGAVLKILDLIISRRGIGNLLAEGTMRAAAEIPGASYYAIHVKGLEIPMADPRGRWSTWTFGNLTNTRGGDHLRNRNPVENLKHNENPIPYLTEKFGFPNELYEKLDIPQSIKKQIFDSVTMDVHIPKMSKWAEDLITVFNIVGICIRPPVLQAVGPSLLADLMTSFTGVEMTQTDLMEIGERTWNLQRLFNIREGESQEDYEFPNRFYEEDLMGNESKSKRLDRIMVQETLKAYYQARDWDEYTGKPTEEKIKQLKL